MSFLTTKTKLPVSLAPCWTGNELDGMTDYMDGLVAKYLSALDGYLLAYCILDIDPVALIHNESPFLHISSTVDLLHFSAKKSDLLFGVVNKFSQDHIGLLVHGIFNASISATEHFFVYNNEHDLLENGVVKLGIGSVLKFEVISTTNDGDLWSINGTLKSEGAGFVDGITAELPPPEFIQLLKTEEVEGSNSDEDSGSEIDYETQNAKIKKDIPDIVLSSKILKKNKKAKKSRDSNIIMNEKE